MRTFLSIITVLFAFFWLISILDIISNRMKLKDFYEEYYAVRCKNDSIFQVKTDYALTKIDSILKSRTLNHKCK